MKSTSSGLREIAMTETPEFRILEERVVYSGRIFDVSDGLVEVGGRRLRRQVAVHPGAVGVVPVLADGRLALVRQYRHGPRERTLEIPAGTLEAGEPPETCARRELEEEVGLRAGGMVPLGPFYPSPGICTEVIHLFAATGLEEVRARPEPDEDIEIEFHAVEKAVRMAVDGRIRDGKTIAALARWLWRERGPG
jgi:ADP-ribose pyrophosphatase